MFCVFVLSHDVIVVVLGRGFICQKKLNIALVAASSNQFHSTKVDNRSDLFNLAGVNGAKHWDESIFKRGPVQNLLWCE